MTGVPFAAKAELVLTRTFDAPRDLIAGDVATMLGDLGDKGVVRW